jgi:hypothetical protein
VREPAKRLTVLAVVVALATTACAGPTEGTSPAAGDNAGAYPRLGETLCGAVSTSDVEAAATAFAAAHGPLHELAADVAGVDRELAGRLHVAKQATEAALSADDHELAAARLQELHTVARESLIAVGEDTAPCGDTDTL